MLSIHPLIGRVVRVLGLSLLIGQVGGAADWPQILGAQRNGWADGEELSTRWPAEGPRLVWEHPVGQGYAGPAVAGGKVVLFHRVDEQERVSAWDATTGALSWKVDLPATYEGGVDADTGPRSVPLIHDGVVYVWGAAGDCSAVTLADGKLRWTQRLGADLEAEAGYFGFGSSPLVAGKLLLINVGGRRGAGLVALRLETGEIAWQATQEQASYSSPILDPASDSQRAIFLTRYHLLSVNAANGEVLARLPFGNRGPTVNAAAPVALGNRQFFVTASYGVGARLVTLQENDWRVDWDQPESLSSQYNTPLFREGVLVGIHGREDVGVAELRGVSVADGKVLWRQADFGVAHLVGAGDRLLALKSSGELVLAAWSREKFQPLADAQLGNQPGATWRALPALSNGMLFVRDLGGRPQEASGEEPAAGMLHCYQVGPSADEAAR